MVSNEKERITITLPKELLIKVKEAATKDNRNISNFLTVILEEKLTKFKE